MKDLFKHILTKCTMPIRKQNVKSVVNKKVRKPKMVPLAYFYACGKYDDVCDEIMAVAALHDLRTKPVSFQEGLKECVGDSDDVFSDCPPSPALPSSSSCNSVA